MILFNSQSPQSIKIKHKQHLQGSQKQPIPMLRQFLQWIQDQIILQEKVPKYSHIFPQLCSTDLAYTLCITHKSNANVARVIPQNNTKTQWEILNIEV